MAIKNNSGAMYFYRLGQIDIDRGSVMRTRSTWKVWAKDAYRRGYFRQYHNPW